MPERLRERESVVLEERDKNLEPRGAILDPSAMARVMRVVRLPPAEALAPWIRHYWFIRWDLAAPHTQSVLPLPTANATLEEHTDGVGLSSSHRFDKTLEGRGAVFGTTFRSTGLRGFVRVPVHTMATERTRFADAFRGDVEALRALGFGGASDAEMVDALDRYWLAEEPSLHPEAMEVERWVELAQSEPALGRAETLASRVGVGLRTLERRLREHTGFTPKQLLRRFRLLEASAQLERGGEIDHAALALMLGYADQAHFARDFAAVVGRPPARYARAQRR